MNRLLLEKIEELTLYIIQLEKENKRIDALQNEQKLLKQNMKEGNNHILDFKVKNYDIKFFPMVIKD